MHFLCHLILFELLAALKIYRSFNLFSIQCLQGCYPCHIAIRQCSHIATRCPWTPGWCLLPLPLPAAPDGWCRNPAQHICSIENCAIRPRCIEYIEYILQSGGRGKPTECVVGSMQRGVRLSHQEQRWKYQYCQQNSGILEQGRFVEALTE